MPKLLIPIAAFVLVVAAMAFQAHEIDPVLMPTPDFHLAEIPGMTSEPVEVSEAEHHTLPADTLFDKRLYRAEDGAWFQVSAVIGGRSKSSLHRPELCLPTQGFQMMSPRTVNVNGIDWRFVTLARRDAPAMGFAYTFFNPQGFRTASHMRRIFRDVWDRSILGRIDRWIMITVYSPIADDARLSAFLNQLKEVIP